MLEFALSVVADSRATKWKPSARGKGDMQQSLCEQAKPPKT